MSMIPKTIVRTTSFRQVEADMRTTVNPDGVQSVEHSDHNGNRVVARQSDDPDFDSLMFPNPGASALLIGSPEAPAYLTHDEVADLVEHLQKWLAEGERSTSACHGSGVIPARVRMRAGSARIRASGEVPRALRA